MLTLQKTQLQAVLTHAAKNDLRQHLNGILIECTASGDIHLVGTDVHRMFCGLIQASNVLWLNDAKVGPWSMIVPRETVELAIKAAGRTSSVLLAAMDNGTYTLGSIQFTPVKGVFPNWRRVLPAIDTLEQDSNTCQFNWEYLADAQKALRLWYGNKLMFSRLHAGGKNGMGQGVITGRDSTAQCVIMGVWDDRANVVTPFSPSPYEAVKEPA